MAEPAPSSPSAKQPLAAHLAGSQTGAVAQGSAERSPDTSSCSLSRSVSGLVKRPHRGIRGGGGEPSPAASCGSCRGACVISIGSWPVGLAASSLAVYPRRRRGQQNSMTAVCCCPCPTTMRCPLASSSSCGRLWCICARAASAGPARQCRHICAGLLLVSPLRRCPPRCPPCF